jgi:hypothetical protein
MKVASYGRHGADAASGKKMEKRFFFDGVVVQSDDFAVGQGNERTVPVFHDSADTPPAGFEFASVGAGTALDAVVVQPFKKSSGFRRNGHDEKGNAFGLFKQAKNGQC